MPESVPIPILHFRGLPVLIDADLARLYGVPTRALNQAVRRNAARFPDDFLFQLTESEKAEVITNCDHLQNLKFSKAVPHAAISNRSWTSGATASPTPKRRMPELTT